MDVGKGREQERKLFRRVREAFAGISRFSLSLEPAYSGLLGDVYNDERGAGER
jgi:hypothetical protein